MTPRLLSLLPVLALAAIHVACQPKIGDDCRTSIDCSPTGERLCDVTQPGGYCTMFNCEPGTCPDDANCVAFDRQLSTELDCRDENGVTRFTRAFCMEICESGDDCRSGYLCEDLKQPGNRLNALAVDKERSGKVCVAPFEAKDPTALGAPHRSAEVCTGAGGANGG